MKYLPGYMATLLLAAATAGAEPDKEQLDFFETKIRPVLIKSCYECHSAEAALKNKLRGGLSLDSREASRAGGDSGPAVVPGDLDESLLISSLRHESFEMPPSGKLADNVVADFVKWIEMGAPDPREGTAVPADTSIDIAAARQFWSFQPIVKLEPPTSDSRWPRTAIDQFVAAKQQAAGLQSNPTANARVLVRRAWFDLLGLPPTPEEMDMWTERLTTPKQQPASELTGDAAIRDDVWEELIDQLLHSSHYGERWARHWMDVARFAESHGYEQDYNRSNAYHYRDFLIRAFNQDLPYDQFVRWQLAGDELAPEEPLAWMATGFLAAGAFPTQLTEAEFESARYDELDDIVATTGVAFLGLSTGCARCHDHKFDPIPSSDYYRLAATFTSAIRSERELDLQPKENDEQRQAYQQKLAQLQEELQRFEQEDLPEQFREWLMDYDSSTNATATWETLKGTVTSTGGTEFVRQDDGSYLATKATPAKEVITLRSATNRKDILAIRLEALADKSLPRKGPGRAPNGNFALGDFQVSVSPTSNTSNDGAGRTQVELVSAQATHQQNGSSLSVAASIDDDPISGWAVDGQIGQDQAAVFAARQPFELTTDEELNIVMTFNHTNTRHTIGRFRLSVSSQAGVEPSVGTQGPDIRVVEALSRLKQKIDPQSADWRTGIDWFKTMSSDWQQRRQALAGHQKSGPSSQLTKVLVASEGLPHLKHHADGRGYPHFYPQTHQLLRGDVHQKGEVAQPGFLQVLMRDGRNQSHWQLQPPPGESRTSFRRASLANWITDDQDGAGQLAARVIVNRLWQHHFGRGLVATPNDFGASGERPSHPELLDWMAAELIEGDWRLKRLHKLIMTSHVYLQSSQFDEDRAAIDRENNLLWRRIPQRLEAEPIRDAMLAVSGQLDSTMYGPGTLNADMRRRSVYFFIKRSQLIPTMMLFDWPEHLVSIGRRASTTIAPQALMFMNSPQGRRYAEAFADRLPKGEAGEAVRQAYRLAFGRSADDREQRLAQEFIQQQTASHQTAGNAAAERLALADLCQALMSSNEFVYVD